MQGESEKEDEKGDNQNRIFFYRVYQTGRTTLNQRKLVKKNKAPDH